MDERDHLGVGHSAGPALLLVDGKVTLPADLTLDHPHASPGAKTTGTHLADTSNLPNASNADTILQADNAALRSENAALKVKLESAELDRGMLQLELGSVNLERHGWGLERERLQREMTDVMRERGELRRMVGALREEVRIGNQRGATVDQILTHDGTRSRQPQLAAGTVGDVTNSPILQSGGNLTNAHPAAPRRGEESSCLRSRSSSEESMDVCDIDAEGRKLEECKRRRGNAEYVEQEDRITGDRDAVSIDDVGKEIEADANRPSQSPFSREIHIRIASFLAGANAYRSLANYSSACRSLRRMLAPVLYETVILDSDQRSYIQAYAQYGIGSRNGWFSMGFHHTRYLFVTRSLENRLLHAGRENHKRQEGDPKLSSHLLVVFPNLRMHVAWDKHLARSGQPLEPGKQIISLEIHQLVDSRALHSILRDVRVRITGKSIPVDGISSIRCDSGKGIVDGYLVPPEDRYRNRSDNGLSIQLSPQQEHLEETLDEMLRMMPREKPHASGRALAVVFPKMRLGTYPHLLRRLQQLFVDAPYALRIEGTIHKPKKNPVPKARHQFSALVQNFKEIWLKIPLANRTTSATSEPIWKMTTPIRKTGMKEVACTICPLEDGSGFVADMQARNGQGGVVEIPGNQYPVVVLPVDGDAEERGGVESGSEYQLIEDSDAEM